MYCRICLKHVRYKGDGLMGRFSSLTEKTYKILTKDEAYEEFPELKTTIAETPPDYVYLAVYDHRPTPLSIPPQLIGPYPSMDIANEAIKQATDQYRSVLSHTEDNIVEFEKVLRCREKDEV
ncbi:FAM171 family protein [Shimazuella sp. AN120528]|uniref:FAM171 family protein n=1 Tax=Shimazuella soli TaxID=1892854 RepID=UPI001F1036C9|nr:FAM171 family protein [Shimazuella soli]MCH5585139.1 FAM171 family protein [Shimazuella soli]